MTLFQTPLGPPQQQLAKVQATATLTTIRDAETNGGQVVAKIHICNKSASTAVIDLEFYDGSVSWAIEYQKSLAVGVSYEVRDVLLARGQSLRLLTSSQPVHTHVVYSTIDRD